MHDGCLRGADQKPVAVGWVNFDVPIALPAKSVRAAFGVYSWALCETPVLIVLKVFSVPIVTVRVLAVGFQVTVELTNVADVAPPPPT